MTKEQKRELAALGRKLSKAIGPGVKITGTETDQRWRAWKRGEYDPTTGVYSVPPRRW